MSMYVYELPYSRLLELYKIMDREQVWRDFAAEVGFSQDDAHAFSMSYMRPGGSPSEMMLTKWGHSNPTVTELFHHLQNIRLYRAISVLRGIIPDSYIREAEARNNQNRRPFGYQLQQSRGPGMEDGRLMSDISNLPGPGLPPPQMDMRSAGTPVPPYQSKAYDSSLVMHKPYQEMSCPGSRPSMSTGSLGAQLYNSNNTSMNAVCSANPPSSTPHSFQVSGGRQAVESTCTYDVEAGNTSDVLVNGHAGSNRAQGCTSSTQRTGQSGTREAALTYTQTFNLQELKDATNDFSPKCKLGEGGFGVVYKGHLSRLKIDVAIKKLKKAEDHQEIEALFLYRHDNIIQLMGYYRDDTTMLLVYSFMEMGALDDRLLRKNDTPPLSWTQRLNILHGTAKAVHYLHSAQDNPMIHGDIKSANILIDKNFEAKIADFGLAKYATSGTFPSKHTHVTNYSPKIYGSQAYLPEEFLRDPSKLNLKTDTYCFGVVVFETCLGVRATNATSISHGKFKLVKDLMEEYREVDDKNYLLKLRDAHCQEWPDSQWHGAVELGYTCTHKKKNKRPEMKEVVDRLEQLTDIANRIISESKKKKVPTATLR